MERGFALEYWQDEQYKEDEIIEREYGENFKRIVKIVEEKGYILNPCPKLEEEIKKDGHCYCCLLHSN